MLYEEDVAANEKNQPEIKDATILRLY